MSRATTAIYEIPATSRKADTPQGSVARVTAWLSDSIARRAVLSIFDQAVVSGTSFVTSVLIGRFCSQTDLGIYYLALSIVLFVRGVQEQLVSAPYTVYSNRHRGDTLAAFGGSSFIHQFTLSLFAMIGLTGLAWATTVGYGPDGFSAISWILIGTVPFLLLREHLRQFVFARLKTGTAIRIDVTIALLQLGSLAGLTAFAALSVPAVFLVMGGSCAAATLGWFLFREQPLRFERGRIFRDWRNNWRFSKWALSSHLVGSSTPYIMPWFVAAIQGTVATGVMAACSTIVGLANVFVTGLTNSLTPQAAHAYADGGVSGLRRVLGKASIIFAVTLGLFCGITFVAGDFVAVLVYGEKYAHVGSIITVFGLSLWAGSIAMTAGNGLWAMDQPSANFRADLFSLMTTVISAVILTPLYGVMGAAFSTFIGAATDAVIRWIILWRLMGEEQRNTGAAAARIKPNCSGNDNVN